MATVELLDLLARVSQPADHRGGRVAADYLRRDGKDISHQKEFDLFCAVREREAGPIDVSGNSRIAKPFSMLCFTSF